jgi:integrase
MFSLAIKWEMRPDNPAKGIERNPEQRRDRFLSGDELARLTEALADHSEQQSANAVRLLLLTGARRGEVLSATWDQFDLENGVWTKPSAHTKQKKDHRVPLSAPALQLLSDMNAASTSDHLFPGKSPDVPMTEIKHFWAAVCRKAKIRDCRLHDLRHTYASILASSGLSLPIVGALLGHTQPGTTARYAHLYDDPLREATERVGAVVSAAGKGETAGRYEESDDCIVPRKPRTKPANLGRRRRSHLCLKDVWAGIAITLSGDCVRARIPPGRQFHRRRPTSCLSGPQWS